ncbi:MAG: hypothetical protein JRJ46_09500 [Deltaproteobacteria bacterium]|nr:hypothetical protein [Deltaproteobacteria bacterium]
MNDIYDAFDWEDMGIIGSVTEEFAEDEMEFLKMEKNNDEWENEDLDEFSEDNFEI